MNYAKQVTDILDTCLHTQQRLWEDWQSLMQGFQGGSARAASPIDVWTEQTKGLLESQLRGLVNAQSVWLRSGLYDFGAWGQMPALMDAWTQQSQKIAENSAMSSKQLVESWVEANRRFDAIKVAKIWNGTLQQALDAWEESLDKMLEAQAALLLRMEQQQRNEKKPAPGGKKAEESHAGGEKAA